MRLAVESDDFDDDELYEVEENLNDYLILLSRLKIKYEECSDKGELLKELVKRLNSVM